jgi:hypothetical protein
VEEITPRKRRLNTRKVKENKKNKAEERDKEEEMRE